MYYPSERRDGQASAFRAKFKIQDLWGGNTKVQHRYSFHFFKHFRREVTTQSQKG